jgi:hypothetical protein
MSNFNLKLPLILVESWMHFSLIGEYRDLSAIAGLAPLINQYFCSFRFEFYNLTLERIIFIDFIHREIMYSSYFPMTLTEGNLRLSHHFKPNFIKLKIIFFIHKTELMVKQLYKATLI